MGQEILMGNIQLVLEIIEYIGDRLNDSCVVLCFISEAIVINWPM